MQEIKIKRGDTYPISFKLTSGNLTCKFTVGAFSTAPQVGDIYHSDNVLYVLLDVSGAVITAISDTPEAPATTGTLTRANGIGDTEIAFTDSESTEVIDITNVTFFMAIKDKPSIETTPDDSQAVYTAEWDTHLDPTNGFTSVLLSSEDTNLPIKKYTAEIQLKAGDNIFSSQNWRISIVQDVNIRTE